MAFRSYIESKTYGVTTFIRHPKNSKANQETTTMETRGFLDHETCINLCYQKLGTYCKTSDLVRSILWTRCK